MHILLCKWLLWHANIRPEPMCTNKMHTNVWQALTIAYKYHVRNYNSITRNEYWLVTVTTVKLFLRLIHFKAIYWRLYDTHKQTKYSMQFDTTEIWHCKFRVQFPFQNGYIFWMINFLADTLIRGITCFRPMQLGFEWCEMLICEKQTCNLLSILSSTRTSEYTHYPYAASF